MRTSIVIPVFNEETNVGILASELRPVLDTLGDAEAILVDDGSRDGTWKAISAAHAADPRIRGIHCEENRGQTSAMLLGLHAATGDVVATLDGDLQNNPADIPKLVAELRQADAVCGYRAKRRDSWSKRVASRIGNRIRNWATKDGLRDTGCSLKVFRRELVNDLPWLNGAHRFMGAYFRLHGRTIVEMPVDHRPRVHGQSKYTNLKRLPRTTADLIGFLWYRSRRLKPTATQTT